MARPVSPTTDLKLTYRYDAVNQVYVADLALSPQGDLQLVAGLDRLVQDVRRWLQVELGNYIFDVNWGNPLWLQRGRPQPHDVQAMVEAAIAVAEQYFLQAQAKAAQEGWLSTDEQLDRFADVQVEHNAQTPGQLAVQFNLVARSGQVRDAELFLALENPPSRLHPPTIDLVRVTATPARLLPGQSAAVSVQYGGSDVVCLSANVGTLTGPPPGGLLCVTGLGTPFTFTGFTYTAPVDIHTEAVGIVAAETSTQYVVTNLALKPRPVLRLAWASPSVALGHHTQLLLTYSGERSVEVSIVYLVAGVPDGGAGMPQDVIIAGTGTLTTIPIDWKAPYVTAPGTGWDAFIPGTGFGAGPEAGSDQVEAGFMPGTGFWPGQTGFIVRAVATDVLDTVHADVLIVPSVSGGMAGPAVYSVAASGAMAGRASGPLHGHAMAGVAASVLTASGAIAGAASGPGVRAYPDSVICGAAFRPNPGGAIAGWAAYPAAAGAIAGGAQRPAARTSMSGAAALDLDGAIGGGAVHGGADSRAMGGAAAQRPHAMAGGAFYGPGSAAGAAYRLNPGGQMAGTAACPYSGGGVAGVSQRPAAQSEMSGAAFYDPTEGAMDGGATRGVADSRSMAGQAMQGTLDSGAMNGGAARI